jgi:flagellar assembly protein FliH
MPSSTDLRATVVLRGVETQHAPPATISADLRTSPFAGRPRVDPRLVDPTLVAVVAEAEEKARRGGWERGLLQGQEAARQEAAARDRARSQQADAETARRDNDWAQLLAAVQAGVAEFDARDVPIFRDVDHTVATMAVHLAEALVGRHLEVGELPALDAVQRALALAPRHSEAIVRLHPDDARRVPDLSDALPGGAVRVVADPSIEVGGCIVEAGNRTIDAQLGPALQRLREVLA